MIVFFTADELCVALPKTKIKFRFFNDLPDNAMQPRFVLDLSIRKILSTSEFDQVALRCQANH